MRTQAGKWMSSASVAERSWIKPRGYEFAMDFQPSALMSCDFQGFCKAFRVSKGSPRHRLQLRRQRLLQVRALQADLLRDGADDRDLLAPRFVGLEQAVAERLESREQ